MKKTKKERNKVLGLIVKICLSIVVLIILVIVGVTGSYLPTKYNDMFTDEYYRKFDDVREKIIAYGLLAPSSHNMQSWKIYLDENDEKTMN